MSSVSLPSGTPKPYQNNNTYQLENPQSTPQNLSSHVFTSNCPCSTHSTTPFIGTRAQAPEWMHYPDLVVGYRINFSTLKLIFKSLFVFHNQTINIWTHLLGVILLIITAFLTCSEHLNTFKAQFHVPPNFHSQPAIGSGKSFCQNMTQTCFNESVLSHNIEGKYLLSDEDQLAYDVCERSVKKHECYLKKSHERKFRNWLEFNSGISMDRWEEMKLTIEKKVIPGFVHDVEKRLGNTTKGIMNEIRHYFGLMEPTQQSQVNQIAQSPGSYNSPQAPNQHTTAYDKAPLAKWPLVFYLICNSITLACSVIFHWFYPLSQKAHKFCRCTDFAGISFLFGFSPIPSIYYGMYCYFEVAEVYLTAMILGAVVVFPASFTERFQDRARPMLRVSIYFCLAVLTVVPLSHMTVNQILFNNYNQAFSLSNSMPWYILGLICYGIGGFFYISHIPNRFSPTGKYDLWGHSHQYWHLMIVMGMMAIYMGCLENYFTRTDSGCAVIDY